MSSQQERDYISDRLMPELREKFGLWSKEYQQPRDLGILGEFVSLYRKVRKLKTIFWDKQKTGEWREDDRTIIMEVVAHGFLMLVDLDRESGLLTERLEDEEDEDPVDAYEEARAKAIQARRDSLKAKRVEEERRKKFLTVRASGEDNG